MCSVYLAGIGEAPPITVHVQHALFDLTRARLEAGLVRLLLGVVGERGVRGGGGGGRGGGGARRPAQTHTPQGHRESDPLHPPAPPPPPAPLSSAAWGDGPASALHRTACRGTYSTCTHTHTHTHPKHTIKEGNQPMRRQQSSQDDSG